jgi:uncharacterized protein (DUF362 family)
MEKNCVVGLHRTEKIQDPLQIRSTLYKLLDGLKQRDAIAIPSNAHVMIKPNICFVKGYETGATVDPFVVQCLVDWLLQNYPIERITIGETDATGLNLNVALRVLGWEEIFDDYPNVRLVNMTHDQKVDVPLEGGRYFTQIAMPKSYMEADTLISVAKLKTHALTGITCNLKNLYGANPDIFKDKYHSNLDDVIVDLTRVKIPHLCVVDGIIAMEGAGPVSGAPKPLGLLIAGNDVVATDHACARLMGFKPSRIRHLRRASKEGLGSTAYEVFGERIEDAGTQFAFIPAWKRAAIDLSQNRLVHRIVNWNQRHESG